MTKYSYAGPILDAHFHMWRYVPTNYPWLEADGLERLRRDFLPNQLQERFQSYGVTASVHIEAGWGGDTLGESHWLTSLKLPAGVADRWVARVPLDHPDAERKLEEQASFEKVVGIRDILTWHPDPTFSRPGNEHRMDDPVWRQNFSRLTDHGFSFDLLISPWQMSDAFILAKENPNTMILVNHCGSPFDRDEVGMAQWRDGLRQLASAPNTMLKISDPVAYDPNWSEQSLRNVISVCIETFGAERSMFASDYPVSGLHIGYGKWLEVFANAIAEYSTEEQQLLFYGAAAKAYKF